MTDDRVRWTYIINHEVNDITYCGLVWKSKSCHICKYELMIPAPLYQFKNIEYRYIEVNTNERFNKSIIRSIQKTCQFRIHSFASQYMSFSYWRMLHSW